MMNKLELSKHRIEALSDGVFAIVMTLLVLELKIPEIPKPVADEAIAGALHHMLPVFLSFFITFCLSALFWYLQSATFHYIRAVNRKLAMLNMLFLMFVSLLPFSAATLGHYLSSPLVQTLYYGNQFAIGLFLVLQWRYAIRAGMIVEGADTNTMRRLGVRIAGIPVAALAAAIAGRFAPEMSGFAFMVVFLIFRLKSR